MINIFLRHDFTPNFEFDFENVPISIDKPCYITMTISHYVDVLHFKIIPANNPIKITPKQILIHTNKEERLGWRHCGDFHDVR